MTRTYSMCDVVIQYSPDDDLEVCLIYVQDFSFRTQDNEIDVKLHPAVRSLLNDEHVRIFNSMKTFTKWLFEIGAVVDNCWFV